MRFDYRTTLAVAALAALGALAACHDNDEYTPPATNTPAGNTTENFSTFASGVFKADANSTPVNFDGITLVYDVNSDAMAFDAFLM